MKNLKLSTFVLTTLVAFNLYARDMDEPVRTPISINSATVVSGSENGEYSAVVSGLLPNSCYSWDNSEVMHTTDLSHEIRAYAKVRQGMCLMVIIPYSEVIPLGKFKSGHHTIRFVNGDGTYQEKSLDVK